MATTLTILGCGSSGGVPRIGLSGWGNCDPENPRNRRRRCSVLVTERNSSGGRTDILIDTSPDLREQLLSADIQNLDAVFYTHDHADHVHGIDDLRPLVQARKEKLPVYAEQETARGISTRFDYCFETPQGSNYPPILDLKLIEEGDVITISGAGGSVSMEPFYIIHGEIRAFGFRINDKALYIPDVSQIPDEAYGKLDQAKVLLIDALRDKPHPSHFSVGQALEVISKVRPQRAILTNLNQDLDYSELAARFSSVFPFIEPAYDGMEIDLK